MSETSVWFRDGKAWEPTPLWSAIHEAITSYASRGDHLYTEVEAVLNRNAIALADEITRAAEAISHMEGELATARQDVIAFCGPWAVRYAQDYGFPNGHIHPAHYDILERAGARMDDFTRASLPPSPTGGEE